MNSFTLRILAADNMFYEGPCVSLVVPTTDGLIGVKAHRENAIIAVVPGILTATTEEGKDPLVGVVSSGMVKVEDNNVFVLVDTVESPDDIDEIRAEQALARAKEELHIKENQAEYAKAQLELNRAVSRLKAKKKYKSR